MLVVRVIAAVSLVSVLAACSPGVTRFSGGEPAPLTNQIESSPLPPPPPGSANGASAPNWTSSGADAWQPYAAPKTRDGHWNGSTAWKYPPQQRSKVSSGSEPVLNTPSDSDQNWARKWVSTVDRAAFDEAVRLSMDGEEGRWRGERGLYGTALPAVAYGKCSKVELMLSSSESGLPIVSRGSIVKCP